MKIKATFFTIVKLIQGREIEQLYSTYSFKFILYYIKVHCIQAPFEAFMGIFLYEWAITFFFEDKIEKNLVITVPLIIAMIVCLLYLVFINGRFINDLLEVRTTYEQEQVPYDEIENMFKTLSIHIHLLGVICYIITTILSLLIIYGANFNCSFYVLFGVGIGVGIVWNLRGYFGDMRIDWKKLCKKTVKYIYEDKYDHIRQQKLRYTINHIVINISSIIIMVFAYLFFAMKTIKFPFNISELEIGKNEFFIVAFIIILIYYIKILYPLYYIQGNSIYYDFKDLFINENNEKI